MGNIKLLKTIPKVNSVYGAEFLAGSIYFIYKKKLNKKTFLDKKVYIYLQLNVFNALLQEHLNND